VLVCVVGPARADAPKLVKSVPADGAKDVPLDVGTIRLEFDRDMDRNAWTLWRSSQGALPPFVDAMKDPWQDARTCVFKLEKLAPDTTYALQLNSARRQGFRSAKGKVALPVTVIVLRTVGVKKKAPPATKPAVLTSRPAAPKKLVVPDEPVGVAVGWQWSGTRKIRLKQDKKIGADPVRAETTIQELAFTEKVVKVEGGRASEVTRELTRADIQQTNAKTGKREKGVICKLPAVFRVAGDDVTDAKTGKAVSAGLAEAVGGTLAPDLWPEKGKLTAGREWTYKGPDLSRRLTFIGARAGTMTLKVERIVALAGTDLAVAQIRGTLKTRVELEVMMDFDGTVEIDLPIAIGIPSRMLFAGDLSAKGTFKDDAGKEITYAVTGRGEFEQTARASDAVVAAVGGKKVKTPPKKEPKKPKDKEPPKPAGEILRTDKGTFETILASPNGSRYLAIAAQGDKDTAFLSGQELTGYAKTGIYIASPDGMHFAFVGFKANGKQFVIVDGKPTAECDKVGYIPTGPVFSRDGKHFAYAAETGKAWYVYVDGTCGKVYQWAGSIVLSADGGHFAHVARRDGKYCVVVDGKPAQGDYDDVRDLRLSDDGKRYACRVRVGKKWQVVVNGKPGRVYEDISDVALSRDGRRVAFAAKKGDGAYVVVDDGREGKTYRRATQVAFSPDGKRVVHNAVDGGWCVMMDGRRVGPGHEMVFLSGLAFSPDGKRIAYSAKRLKRQVAIVDGQTGRMYDWVLGITFSPDGKHVAYRADDGYRHHRIVLDGDEQESYDRVSDPAFTKPVFTRPAQLVYLAAKGGVLYRVRQDLAGTK
jgi:hypothetical protein